MATSTPELPLQGTKGYPVIGLGTYTAFGKTGGDEAVTNAVKHAIDIGYRNFDCAWLYSNEKAVGEGIKEKIKSGVVKRKDVFLSTKLWCSHHNPAKVRENCQKSLDNLQFDYIDLYLMHWPMSVKDGDEIFPVDKDGNVIFAEHDFVETWKGMEELVDLGLVKSIGVCNFNCSQLDRLLKNCRIKPVNHQIEVHPYFSNKKVVEFSQSHGISVTAHAPLGNPTSFALRGGKVTSEKSSQTLINDPCLQEIGKPKGKTAVQVCLRFLLQRNLVVIPKSVTKSRIEENFKIFDFQLSDEEMQKIWKLDRGSRLVKLENYMVAAKFEWWRREPGFNVPGKRPPTFHKIGGHKDYPFKEEL